MASPTGNTTLLGRLKRLAGALREDAQTPGDRFALCRRLLSTTTRDGRFATLAAALGNLSADERHYWVGTFYTLLLTPEQRRAQAAYFTPPHLSKEITALVRRHGFDPLTQRVMDPAAGGAAFLSTIAAAMRDAGGTPRQAAGRLSGIELDSGLARLSELLIAERLGCEISPGEIVIRGDGLAVDDGRKHDLVIANPPYGRLSLSGQEDDDWEAVCHPGHINKYALFTKRCFEMAKNDGLVALVIPSSFVAGPLYDRLRAFIRKRGEVLCLGSVVNRDDVFVDVAQDVCVLLSRAGSAHRKTTQVAFGRFSDEKPFAPMTTFALPKAVSDPWSVPVSRTGLPRGGATLEDYGVTLRSGYFVWNREQDRMKTRCDRKLDVPLIWARNVSPGKLCRPQARGGRGVDYVTFEEPSLAIVREPAIVLQRTTNSSQPRRLIAARVADEVYERWGGFVSENHTIVATGDGERKLTLICRLLNSRAVDARYRQLSGTASVSVTLLRTLDLPDPDVLEAEAAKTYDFDQAVVAAYAKSNRMAVAA